MRPPLLFLSQCLPYPPHSGVTNRTYNILRQLAVGFDIRLLAFSRRNHQPDAQAVARAREGIECERVRLSGPFSIVSEGSGIGRLLVHVKSLLSGRPYTYFDYYDARVEEVLRSTLRDAAPSLIHMDSLDLYRWVAELGGIPTACTHHSIESDLLRLRAERIGSPAASWYLHHQANLIQKVERDYCPAFAVNVVMSDLDGARLRTLVPGSRVLTVPNGVDTDFFRPNPSASPVEGRVAFLGPTYMFPNRDGIDFLLNAIWPRIIARMGTASLDLIGHVSPAEQPRFENHPRVRCLGYVEDIRPPLEAAACCVVPLRVGGGTRLKILDAWSMGIAVVSTTIGCEGLDARDGENILIRDDPASFGDAVLSVLRDKELRKELGTGARRTAERTYAWNTIGEHLRRAYLDLHA